MFAKPEQLLLRRSWPEEAEKQRRRQALARLTLRGIEFNGVDRHIIDNLLQGIDGQRCILIRRFCFPLRTTLMTGLLVLASMTSASKYRSVSMVRWPVAVPATIIATGITS